MDAEDATDGAVSDAFIEKFLDLLFMSGELRL